MELWEFGIFWQASVCGMGVLYSCNILRPADSTICGSTLYNLSLFKSCVALLVEDWTEGGRVAGALVCGPFGAQK